MKIELVNEQLNSKNVPKPKEKASTSFEIEAFS